MISDWILFIASLFWANWFLINWASSAITNLNLILYRLASLLNESYDVIHNDFALGLILEIIFSLSSILPKIKCIEQFKTLLRSYQLEGFKWLKTLSSYDFGGILADDMGLGKTLEIISFVDSDSKQAPSLIVLNKDCFYLFPYMKF